MQTSNLNCWVLHAESLCFFQWIIHTWLLDQKHMCIYMWVQVSYIDYLEVPEMRANIVCEISNLNSHDFLHNTQGMLICLLTKNEFYCNNKGNNMHIQLVKCNHPYSWNSNDTIKLDYQNHSLAHSCINLLFKNKKIRMEDKILPYLTIVAIPNPNCIIHGLQKD